MGKNILIFVAGVVTGVVLMILIAGLASNGNASNGNASNGNASNGNTVDNGITIFETEGDCVSCNSFEVFQVLDSGDALAKEFKHGLAIATGVTVLFLNDGNKYYYDKQVIKVPSGKCAKQIGIFKYDTRIGVNTVPIVEIRDK